jgi:FixJ family two-component response regulator
MGALAVESLSLAPTIYVVDDDADVRDSMRVLLEMNGYLVELFSSGLDLLTNGDPTRPLCIIMDVNLPGDSGLQILSRLRTQSVTTPVLVVTARPSDTNRRESERLNAAGFFRKPVPPEVLFAAIHALRRIQAS